MRRGVGRLPLHQRVRTGETPSPDVGPGGRHCWVLDAVDRDGVKRAGLLLEWRRAARDASWEGRVVYLARLRPDEWASVEEWLPAERLEPA